MNKLNRCLILFLLACLAIADVKFGMTDRLVKGQEQMNQLRAGKTEPRETSNFSDYGNKMDEIRQSVYVKASDLADVKANRVKLEEQKNNIYEPNMSVYVKPQDTIANQGVNSIVNLLHGITTEDSAKPKLIQVLEDQTAPLEKDYEEILEAFRSIGCFKSLNLEESIKTLRENKSLHRNKVIPQPLPSNPYSLCESELADQLFKPLTDTQVHGSEMYEHFNNNVYRPLSYNVFKNRFSFNDALQDLLNLDPDNLTIKKDLPIPNFERFKQMVVGGYSQIAQYSSNFEENKDIISSIIMDILKNFHIYWNVKRQRNQIDSTKSSTYSILKAIIRQYRQTNHVMKAITVHFLTLIRNAYKVFIKAHKIFKIVTSQAATLFSYQILKRYDSNIQAMLDGEASPNSVFFELSIFMDMYRGVMLTNASGGIKDADLKSQFQTGVIDKIIAIYDAYAVSLKESNDPNLDKITDFTAAIILKFKQREGIMIWRSTGIGYGSQESFMFDNGKTTYLKLYYELMDMLMIIPSLCVDYDRLSACITALGTDSIARLRTKYGLWYSTNGHSLVRHFEGLCWQMHFAVNAKNGYSNFNFFRNLYFAELFKVAEQIKTNYCINDMSMVAKFQDKLGELIQKEKSADGIDMEIVNMLGDLDNKLYDFFLDVKNDYNGYVHIDRNPTILKEIVEKFDALIDEFVDKNHAICKRKEIIGLWEIVKTFARNWSVPYLEKYTDLIEGSVADTPSSVYTPMPTPNSFEISNIINEPQIDTGASSPIFIPKQTN